MNNYYSTNIPKILDIDQRTIIGKEILAILGHHLGDLSDKVVLDYGCSAGVITNILAKHVKNIVGIDVDKAAIKIANKNFKDKNVTFRHVDGLETRLGSKKFDIVIANQIYNFVDNDIKLMKEIYRILKPGGICYFGARNKYAFVEPQYDILFLSWYPKWLSDFIVKRTNKGSNFIGKYRSYYGIKNLVKGFKLHDYTLKILRDPEKYNFVKLIKYKYLFRFFPLNLLKPLIPNYIWILEK